MKLFWPAQQNRHHHWGRMLFILLACAEFSLTYLSQHQQFMNLRTYAAETGDAPYQGRILMAWILHLTAANPALIRFCSHLSSMYRDPYLFVLLVTTYAAMLIAVLATRATLIRLLGDPVFATSAALLTLYMTYFNLATTYGLTYVLPYDVPSLAFFSVGVWLIFCGRYRWLLFVFAAATFNRETTCFLTLFLALMCFFSRREKPAIADLFEPKKVIPHVALQASMWIAIRWWIHRRLLHNSTSDMTSGNGLFVLHLRQNLHSVLNPAQWPLFLSLFGYALPFIFVYRKEISYSPLQKSLFVVLPVWAIAMMLVGTIVEVRIFTELTAFIAPAAALILHNIWREKLSHHYASE